MSTDLVDELKPNLGVCRAASSVQLEATIWEAEPFVTLKPSTQCPAYDQASFFKR